MRHDLRALFIREGGGEECACGGSKVVKGLETGSISSRAKERVGEEGRRQTS